LEIEVVQKVGDAPLTICGTCGGDLMKVIAPCGIIFKGSGFHITDYKGDMRKSETPSSEKVSDKAETASSEGLKSESSKASSGADSTGSSGAAEKRAA
jgi:predicted nucleic acid-binding Zn ribbon protein